MEKTDIGVHVECAELVQTICHACGHKEVYSDKDGNELVAFGELDMEDEPCPKCGGTLFGALVKIDVKLVK